MDTLYCEILRKISLLIILITVLIAVIIITREMEFVLADRRNLSFHQIVPTLRAREEASVYCDT